MTPPAATAAGRAAIPPSRSRTAARKPGPARGARRVSGPAGGARSLRAGQGAYAGGAGTAVLDAPLGLRIARRAAAVQDARLLDRLIRGRAWIAIVATMLIGLVFVQVSLLKLNAGIGRDAEAAQVLQRENAGIRGSIAARDSTDRVISQATQLGMVMPDPANVTFLTATRGR